MNFIIDAKNLAGKLGILGEKDFDRHLIAIIRTWLGQKKKTVVLVFDSLDPMGDRESDGYLEIIYSPRDGYQRTADEKIIDIFSQWSLWERSQTGSAYTLNIIGSLQKDDLSFVSDDIDLRQRVKVITAGLREKIKLLSCEEFIAFLEGKEIDSSIEDSEDRGLDSEETAAINSELLALWKKSK
jgi:hypothetical protein